MGLLRLSKFQSRISLELIMRTPLAIRSSSHPRNTCEAFPNLYEDDLLLVTALDEIFRRNILLGVLEIF
jgi:hypothetical protein